MGRSVQRVGLTCDRRSGALAPTPFGSGPSEGPSPRTASANEPKSGEHIMRRLLTVALGAALCSLATGAEARPSDFPAVHGDAYRYDLNGDSDRSYMRPGKRSAARRGSRRASAGRSDRRYANVRANRGGGGNATASVAQRGLTTYARGGGGGGGASRTCLTPAARALLG